MQWRHFWKLHQGVLLRLETCKSSISSDRVLCWSCLRWVLLCLVAPRPSSPTGLTVSGHFPSSSQREANLQTPFGNSPWQCRQPWVGAQDPAVFPSPGDSREVHFRWQKFTVEVNCLNPSYSLWIALTMERNSPKHLFQYKIMPLLPCTYFSSLRAQGSYLGLLTVLPREICKCFIASKSS